jgi:phosphatidylinositol alpha-mannosyltransferase
VASNIEGFAGVVTDGVQALLVQPKDHRSLASAIARLLDNPKLADSLAANARTHAELYSWDNVARRVMSYYERLLYERQEVAAIRERRAEGLGS